jgi:branched-chain amino acid transport system permease protein
VSAYWPFIVIGIFTGSLYGLAAMGVVLTYKTVGVFNFAYGAIAMFCAFTYWQIHDQWGISAWLAMPILFLVVAPLIGIILEALFRPLSGIAAEVVIVVSLGLLAALSAGATLIWPEDHQLQPIFPISTFVLGSHLHVGYDQLGTLLVSLLMAALLWALLRRTRFGTYTRAVVDNPDLADMTGVHGDNVRRTAWILSSIFAAVVGVLISPSQGLDVNELILVVIYAFAPAVLGVIFGLPSAYLGGIGLGIAVSVLSKFSNSGTVSNVEAALPYILLLLLLLFFGTRLKDTGATARRLALARTTLSAKTRAFVSLGPLHIDRAFIVGTVGIAFAFFVPLFIPGPHLVVVSQGFVLALIALTLIVLTGWAGQISLAQYSFVGVGAFTAGHLAGTHGQHFLFAVLMGMVFCIPLGVLVGLISLRLSGLYLALGTLAFALVMDNMVFNRSDVSGGLTGITVPEPHFFGIAFTGRVALYELAVVVFAIFLLLAYLIRLGPIGRRLQIVRDSPLAASTLGVNLTVTKIVVFVICAMVASVGGAMTGAITPAITPLNFQWSNSLELLLLVVLGGRSVLSGASIAGFAYAIPLIPGMPAKAAQIIPLAIAIGVIGLAQESEGTIALAIRQTRFVMAILRPLPHTASYGTPATSTPELELSPTHAG